MALRLLGHTHFNSLPTGTQIVSQAVQREIYSLNGLAIVRRRQANEFIELHAGILIAMLN